MNLNEYIDHTILSADATSIKVSELCDQAKKYHFYCVCVNPCYISLANQSLEGSNVKIATVVGFPLGMTTSNNKLAECIEAIENGASEIDMVINIGELKASNYDYVSKEIYTLAKACHEKSAILKVIIETALLTEDEIIKASEICCENNADFIKTSTGFSTRGANIHDIEIIKETILRLGKNLKIKASGGIRDLDFALALIDAGADRLGTSSGVKIIQEYRARQ